MDQATLFEGFGLIIAGGIMEGAYSFPLKFSPKWQWENIWGAGSLMALVLIPWPLAFLTIPRLTAAYHAASWSAILWALVFGAGWGLGGIFVGLSIELVGVAVGLSIVLGIIAINGSLTPLLMNDPGQLRTAGGLWFLLAMLVMIIGIAVCAVAGKRKETAPPSLASARRGRSAFRIGLTFCILSGLLSGLVNFALIFGTEITERAKETGAGNLSAINALWALVFTSNYVVNVVYCAYLMWRNRTVSKFVEKGTGLYWLQAAVMGATWAGGVVLYGIGASKLGKYGAFIGFPVLLVISILTANALGWFAGEWRGSSAKTAFTMGCGVVLLLLAISFLGNAERLMSR